MVKTQYRAAKLDSDLIKLMARKVNLTSYTNMIVDYLNGTGANNFKKICMEISPVQRLAGILNLKSKKSSNKEIAVVGVVDNQKDDKKYGGGGKGNSDKTCNFCHKKGHTEDKSWKIYPNQLPKWVQDKQKKRESGGQTDSVEVVVASVKGLDFQQACC